MELLFIGLMIWICGSIIFAEIFPALIELFIYLVQFAFLCLWHAVKGMLWILRHIGDALGRSAAHGWHHLRLFLALLFEEWRHGPQAGDQEDEEPVFADDDDADDPHPSPYDLALAILGLREPFTHADLKHVYRQGMKQAHTDVGGRKEDAQALNAARDLVMQTHGWK